MPSKAILGRKKQHQLLDCYDNLEGSLEYAWRLLERGSRDRHSVFHTPTVATVSADGRPAIRTVVLRGCERTTRRLRFHTDRRAAKVAQLLKDPRGAMHAYDAVEKIQLRLDVRLVPIEASEIDAIWDTTKAMSRVCYQSVTTPGSPLHHPSDIAFDPAQTRDGVEHFLPIGAWIERIEWLYLAARGHRRAEFRWTDEGLFSQWLAP